jgi:hypothetical protein
MTERAQVLRSAVQAWKEASGQLTIPFSILKSTHISTPMFLRKLSQIGDTSVPLSLDRSGFPLIGKASDRGLAWEFNTAVVPASLHSRDGTFRATSPAVTT